MIVYMHINKQNGKKYIGISQNIKRRWRPSEYKKSTRFNNAIEKYGWDNFEHIILFDDLSVEEAKQKEIELIKAYRTQDRKYGYNIGNGGDINRLGIKNTDEQRKKISQSLKGKYKGRHFSPKSEFKKGHVLGEETRKKISEAHKNKPVWNKGLKGYNAGNKNPMKRPEVIEKHKGINNGRALRINQYDINNNLIRTWDYMSQIKEELNYNVSNISNCCRGKLKKAYNYKWKYDNTEA